MPIPSGDAAVILLAEALGRHRALNDVESLVLERAITRQPKRDRRWTREEDRMLLKMCGRRVQARITAAAMAAQLGRTPQAVRQRLCDLRKRDA